MMFDGRTRDEQIEVFEQLFKNSYDYKEALDRRNLKLSDIEELREKLADCEHVPKVLIDNQLMVFLNACDGDIEMTAKKLNRYYEIKRTVPEFFTNRDVESEEVQKCLDNLHYVALPVTPDDCYLILHRLRTFQPKEYNFESAVKTYIMKAEEYAYNNGPRAGTIFIDDLKGASLGHVFRPSMSSVRKGLRFLQEGSPLNVKAIHILNTVPFVSMMINMVKPYLMSEMLNKIHFHPSNMDYEEFYKKHIPKSCLPSDYGGDLESVEVLHNKQRKSFSAMKPYFQMEELQQNFGYDHGYDEFMEKRKERLEMFKKRHYLK